VVQDDYLDIGRKLKDFLQDKRLREQTVTVTIDKSMVKTYQFSFMEIGERSLRLQEYNLSLEEYRRHCAQRAQAKTSEEEASSWEAFLRKLSERTLLRSETLNVPSVKGQIAQAVVLSVLTPLEKDLMSLSQSNWAKVRTEHKDSMLSALGTYPRDVARIEYVNARFSGNEAAVNPYRGENLPVVERVHRKTDALMAVLVPRGDTRISGEVVPPPSTDGASARTGNILDQLLNRSKPINFNGDSRSVKSDPPIKEKKKGKSKDDPDPSTPKK
jgi:hypothetical protein